MPPKASSYSAGDQWADELPEIQKLLRATLDASMDMIQVFQAIRNEQGHIIDFTWLLNNHAAEKVYGDVVGKSLLQRQPGVVEEGIFEIFKQVVDTGEPQHYEKHYVHEQFNGWFHQSVVKLNDGVATTTANITSRKTAEQQLQQSRAFLQSVIDSSLDIIQVFKAVRGEAGQILDFVWVMNNQKAVAQNGEVIGKSLLELNPGVVQAGIFDHMVEVAQTGVAYEHEQYYNHEQFDGWFYLALVKTDDGVAMTTRDISRQKRAEGEVLRLKEEIARKATDKYRILFETIDEGFCVQELLFDQHGEVDDLIYHEANQAFERHTGFADINGKRASEVFPHIEPNWFGALQRVYQTGVAQRTEGYNVDTQRWLTAHYSPVGGAGSPFIAAVFQDITERKRREQQQAYLLDLNDVLRSMADPIAIQRAAMRILGEHLGVDRAIYAEVNLDEDWFDATDTYTRKSVQPVTGRFPFTAFGPAGELLKKGESLVIDDVRTEVDEDAQKAFYSIDVLAVVAVPLVKNGKLVADLSVHQTTPRHWQDHEVGLLQETAERTWAAVERAKAEAALRESEEKFRTVFQSIDEGVSTLEAIFDEEGKAVDYRYLENNPVVKTIFGFEWPVGKTVREFLPTVEPYWIETICGVARTGERVRTEYPVESLQRWISAHFSRIGGEGSRQVVAVYEDITERKARERQQTFLLRFSDSLRIQPNPDALANRALQLLAEQLELDRCYIGVYQPAQDRADITHQVGNTRVPPMPDTICLSDFPQALRISFERTLVIDDFSQTEGLSDTDKRNIGTLGLRALVAATLRKGENNPYWAIVAVSAVPRRWTPNEIQLIEEVTERTWAALERARVEEAMQESEKRLRLVIEATELATWEWNLETNQVYWNEQHFKLFGMTPGPNPVSPDDFMRHVHPHERSLPSGAFMIRSSVPCWKTVPNAG
ncbi:PAS domain S-box-containing protein [Spirosoma lacussanchae]